MLKIPNGGQLLLLMTFPAMDSLWFATVRLTSIGKVTVPLLLIVSQGPPIAMALIKLL